AGACRRGGPVFFGPRAGSFGEPGGKNFAPRLAPEGNVPALLGRASAVRRNPAGPPPARKGRDPALITAATGGGGRGVGAAGAERGRRGHARGGQRRADRRGPRAGPPRGRRCIRRRRRVPGKVHSAGPAYRGAIAR